MDVDVTVVQFTARPGWGRFAYLPALVILARRLKREGARVDVVHAHVHWIGWVAVQLGTLLRRPVVITEHSTEWPTHTLSRRSLRRAKSAFRRASLVCPVNRQLQDAIESYGVRARFRIVPNAVDTKTFHPRPTGREGAPKRLINVALHTERKGLDVLLQAVAKLLASRPDLTLDLVGEGPSTAQLRKLATTLGIAERVRFRGTAPPSEIADALRESDVFVFASLSENMPLGVLEALCCGLPVAATNVGGIPEAVGADGALAPPGDADALASAIEDVLERYSAFDRSEIAARAATRYSFEAVGAIWDEIYRSL